MSSFRCDQKSENLCLPPEPFVWVYVTWAGGRVHPDGMVATVLGYVHTKPSFHMIAHDRRIAENSGSDYMEILFRDRAIVGDRER